MREPSLCNTVRPNKIAKSSIHGAGGTRVSGERIGMPGTTAPGLPTEGVWSQIVDIAMGALERADAELEETADRVVGDN